MKKLLVITPLILIVLSGCGGKKGLVNPTLVDNEYLGLHAQWVKDKGDKFDLMMAIENKSKNKLEFSRNSMRCGKGGKVGNLHYTSQDKRFAGVWQLWPGDRVNFYIICKLGVDKIKGKYEFSIHNIRQKSDKSGNKDKVVLKKVQGAIQLEE